MEFSVPCSPLVLLLNDDSPLNLTFQQQQVWLSGLTKAYIGSPLMEQCVARLHGVKQQNVDILIKAVGSIWGLLL